MRGRAAWLGASGVAVTAGVGLIGVGGALAFATWQMGFFENKSSIPVARLPTMTIHAATGAELAQAERLLGGDTEAIDTRMAIQASVQRQHAELATRCQVHGPLAATVMLDSKGRIAHVVHEDPCVRSVLTGLETHTSLASAVEARIGVIVYP